MNAVGLKPMSDPRAILARLEGADPADVLAALAELDALFAAQRPKLLRACRKMVRDRERADELAQEAMTIAYGKLSDFRAGESFGGWLYGIARNLAWRHHQKKKDLLFSDGVMDAADLGSGVVTLMQRDEREALMRRATQALEPLERKAILLRYVEGLSQDEITERLGLESRSGARGLLQRCRRKLSRTLRQQLVEMGHGTSFIRDR